MTRLLICIPILLLVWACGGDNDQPAPPSAPQLQFPENNSECFEGVVNSVNPNVSSIEFRWEPASNASSYQLNIKNLISGQMRSQTTSGASLAVELDRGTPYSWYVEASSSATPNETAQSATWKFYNAGEGIASYVPFPADLIYPPSGASLSLNGSSALDLRWEGADLDNDISDYEVFFGTDSPPATSIGSSGTAQQIRVENLSPGTTYYWKVITTDQQGNKADSEISEFRIAN
ncbi:fibronectin type III domain-containing protein [Robertkochia flava]|uniref:fibronectin type III domain-containing protein n=1 Tax=Robertkochia flava TaxID=3447986 RepID=UPI001CC918D7|nr:fibronectin type III domain-containing protein [Robertkochia marina]